MYEIYENLWWEVNFNEADSSLITYSFLSRHLSDKKIESFRIKVKCQFMRNVQSNFFSQDIFLALNFLEKKKKRGEKDSPDLSRAFQTQKTKLRQG